MGHEGVAIPGVGSTGRIGVEEIELPAEGHVVASDMNLCVASVDGDAEACVVGHSVACDDSRAAARSLPRGGAGLDCDLRNIRATD